MCLWQHPPFVRQCVPQMLIMGIPHLGNNASPICTTIGKKRRYKCANVQMYQSPNVQMYQSAILGSPPYPKLCGVVIIAHYNLYQIVCSPRVADASPICTIMPPPLYQTVCYPRVAFGAISCIICKSSCTKCKSSQPAQTPDRREV